MRAGEMQNWTKGCVMHKTCCDSKYVVIIFFGGTVKIGISENKVKDFDIVSVYYQQTFEGKKENKNNPKELY